MNVEYDVWAPPVIQAVYDQASLCLCEHEPITVVIVAGVFIVQVGWYGAFVVRVAGRVVPTFHFYQAVGIQTGHENQYDVVEDSSNTRIIL